jgi:hypothetical protein
MTTLGVLGKPQRRAAVRAPLCAPRALRAAAAPAPPSAPEAQPRLRPSVAAAALEGGCSAPRPIPVAVFEKEERKRSM